MSIVELGMVKRVEIDGSSVRLEVALTVAGCPLRGEITNRVTAALTPLGVDDVAVDMTVMTDEERHAVREKLGRQGAPQGEAAGQRLGHEEGRANPFMAP